MSTIGTADAETSVPRPAAILVGVAAALLTGCAIRGPQFVPASRLAYNEAVQLSDQRELLLNLVRLRYLEAPEFLAVSSISTQMRFEASGEIGGQIGEAGIDGITLLSPGAGIGFSESPTITFVPQRDQAFTRQLVTPVSVDTIYLLTHYGWGLDRILRLTASDINGVSNRLTREQSSGVDEALRRFRDLAASLRRLEEAGLLRVVVDPRRTILSDAIPETTVSADEVLNAAKGGFRFDRDADTGSYVLTGEQTGYSLEFEPEVRADPDFRAIADAVGLAEERARYGIETGDDADSDSVRVLTRSVLGAMAYLSNGVAVPIKHEPLTGGEVLHNGPVLGDLLDVRVSESPRDDAFLQVQHRGHWFYIDDRDLESKRTLGLLTSLIRLSISARGTQDAPILTLPVSR